MGKKSTENIAREKYYLEFWRRYRFSRLCEFQKRYLYSRCTYPKRPEPSVMRMACILRPIRIFLKIFFMVSIPPSSILFMVNQWSSFCKVIFRIICNMVLPYAAAIAMHSINSLSVNIYV